MRRRKRLLGAWLIGACWMILGISWQPAGAATAPGSEATEQCLACHADATPGIVADWEKSRHSRITPLDARQIKGLSLKVSSDSIPAKLAPTTVGCAECHLANPDKHPDSYEHNGYQVHTVVTPVDCAVCHVQETDQYKHNIMSHAYGNLMNNPVYRDLMKSVNGDQQMVRGHLEASQATDRTRADSCLSCHGTKVEMTGLVTRDTDFGEMAFPQLTGWPSNGVGRINPDGSQGSCASCHTRHQFSIEVARKPETCGQCHSGPDVPAYKIYKASKHGNLYSSLNGDWNFRTVPWVLGKDFSAPTCAACHVSLVTDAQGSVITRRTHQMTDRLPWRIFGLIYAHPQPKEPDTSGLKNAAGLSLPTDFNGAPALAGLIDQDEQNRRRDVLQNVCLGCHSKNWVDGHWRRFEHTIATADGMTLTATRIMQQIWTRGLAQGLPQHSPFDEAVEKTWVEQWLFFGNSVRYSSAMLGSDYGVFENGRWYQSKNLRELKSWLDFRRQHK